METKRILLTGLTGQDGSYMAEYLLNLGYQVYGMIRRTSQIHDRNFRHLLSNPNLKLARGDLLDSVSLDTLVQDIKPNYFINFAAQSFVGDSWKIPEETFMAGAVGVLKCLEAVRKYAPQCRFYNAGSSEQFGDVIYSPQDEKHPFRPRSPYGAAKAAAHFLVKVYRESYGIYAVQGMLFNHESERRGEEFVTRKITKGFARILKAIKEGKEFEPIYLGNIDSKRDWSHASDFMDAVWRMLNQDQYNPYLKDIASNLDETHNSWQKDIIGNLKEYVVASGVSHTVRDFINIASHHLDLDCDWVGRGVSEKLVINEHFINKFNIKSSHLVAIDPAFYRPADVETLLGTPYAITTGLGWEPKISFDKMVKLMVSHDLLELGLDNNFQPLDTLT